MIDQLENNVSPSTPLADLTIVSFGFNRHAPPEGYLVFDARGIRNPERRFAGTGKTGVDDEVRDYVLGTSIEAQLLVARIFRAILEQGHTHIAIGCSWGHHRSVSIAVAVARYVATITGVLPTLIHMELE